ncbi:MAG: hypothetical protein VYC94_03895, partial [Cyanobacteriota bacterium]|nr:hypothetical protein [Cyanobacteriota bacterium]
MFLSGDEEAPGPLEQRIFSLEVLPSVSPAAARHKRHCFVKMWWLSWGARYLWLRRFVDLHVLKWEVVWCRLEQQKQLEEVERRAEEARVDLVFWAQRQLTRRKGRHWGLGPSPGPRLSPEWVVWERDRRVLLGDEVRLLVVERARAAARAVVADVLAAAAAGVVEKGGASEAQVGPTGQTTASGGGNFALLAGARMHRECMGGTGAGSPARQPQPASTEQHNLYSCSFIPAGGSHHQDTDAPSTPFSTPTPRSSNSSSSGGSSSSNGGSSSGRRQRRSRRSGKRKAKAKLAAELSAAISREVDGAAGGEGTSEDKGKGTSRGKGKSKSKSKGKAAGVPRQGGSEAARRVDALEAGGYDATGLEEVDLAERFTRSLLEDA